MTNRTSSHRIVFGLFCAVALILTGCSDDENPVGGGDDTSNAGAPTALISADPTSVPQNDGHSTVVTITAEDSTDPDGDDLSYEWTVENGRFANGTDAGDETIQVTFPGAAPYTVTVVVSDGNGNSDSASVTIGIQGTTVDPY